MVRKRKTETENTGSIIDLAQGVGLTLLSDARSEDNTDWLPTDIPHFDRLSPLKMGTVVHTYGKLASGKSTLAVHLAKQAQKFDLPVVFFDVEATTSAENMDKLGIDSSKIFVERPTKENLMTIESITERIREIINVFDEAGKECLIIWDSIAMTPTGNQADGQNRMADQANATTYMTKVIGQTIAQSNALLVIINQARDDMEAFRAPGMPAPIKPTGGNALGHWASTSLEVGKVKKQKGKRLNPITGKEEEKYIGHVLRSKVVKSKNSTPDSVFDVFLISDPYKGIDFAENVYRTSVAVQDTKNQYGFISGGAWRNYTTLDGKEIKLRDAEWVPFLESEEGQPVLEELWLRQMLANFPDWYAPLDNKGFDITEDPKYAKLKEIYLNKQKASESQPETEVDTNAE